MLTHFNDLCLTCIRFSRAVDVSLGAPMCYIRSGWWDRRWNHLHRAPWPSAKQWRNQGSGHATSHVPELRHQRMDLAKKLIMREPGKAERLFMQHTQDNYYCREC